MFRSGKLTVTVSSGSGAPLPGRQLSFVIVAGGAACNSGVPGTPQQANRWRAISRVTQPTVPTSIAPVSDILNIQTPFNPLPFNADRGESGLNDPANGAVPAPIAIAPESSKTVGTPEQSFAPVPKLSPPPPRLLASATEVPSGAISLITRSPSKVWFRRTLTLTSATAPTSVTLMGMSTELTSGIRAAMLPVL